MNLSHTLVRLPSLALSLALAAAASLVACDDATVGAEQCSAPGLAEACPPGSNIVLGAQAEASCGGNFDANLVTESGSATGQCSSTGECQFLCQFTVPCTCGVKTISKSEIVCNECQAQSCGDGRCEGTERAACEPGQSGCFACAEDCDGATCGDGDCTAGENPTTCPQDCADTCQPNSSFCVGTIAKLCAANGKSTTDADCSASGQVCREGACVAP